MTTTVLLVRHGRTESNITGYYMGWSHEDMNDVGYTQVHNLSARLANLPIVSFYASPLKRTCNTASILAEPHALELKVLDDLIEINPPNVSHTSLAQIKNGFEQVLIDFSSAEECFKNSF